MDPCESLSQVKLHIFIKTMLRVDSFTHTAKSATPKSVGDQVDGPPSNARKNKNSGISVVSAQSAAYSFFTRTTLPWGPNKSSWWCGLTGVLFILPALPTVLLVQTPNFSQIFWAIIWTFQAVCSVKSDYIHMGTPSIWHGIYISIHIYLILIYSFLNVLYLFLFF